MNCTSRAQGAPGPGLGAQVYPRRPRASSNFDFDACLDKTEWNICGTHKLLRDVVEALHKFWVVILGTPEISKCVFMNFIFHKRPCALNIGRGSLCVPTFGVSSLLSES